MVKYWLPDENIHIVERVADWKEAITLAAQPLLTQKCISSAYVDAIFSAHRTLGPYYVIAPGFALPHARPEQGALKNGLSLLCIKNGVYFNSTENDPVNLVIMLSAISSTEHIKLISALADIVSDQDKLNRLMTAHSVHDVYQLIH